MRTEKGKEGEWGEGKVTHGDGFTLFPLFPPLFPFPFSLRISFLFFLFPWHPRTATQCYFESAKAI